MPTQCSLTSNLALLMLLGTVTAGPFSPRSNVTLPAPRPPPQPGGRTVQPERGGPSSRLYEHTVEGGEKQVVFTHRINLPPSAGCGCPPGTEPPVPASEVQALRVRLEILEELVKGLKEQCTGGCCPPAAQAGTGQTDIRSLCSLHGVFDLSRCACSCEPGWGGPTCSDPASAEGPPSSPPSAPGSCPDDCNDQGRCVRGRCVCFPGYTGPSCSWPSCPGDCHGRGRCVQGVCVCRAGFSGDDCSVRSCPRGCSQRGRCEDGRCVCNPGYSGEDCGVRSCPRDCSQRGRCENGRCVCNPGYTGDDCGVRSCPRGCSQKGRCEDGRCVCDPGYAGDDCGSRTCPWDCGEGGRCVDGRCVCWPGYAGEDCSTRTCPRDCRGRGRCEDGECICDPGYSGDDCGVRSCPGDCNQRGRCEDGRCVCWPGYSGPDCGARACPRDCRGRGRCENGVCVCHAGYSGEDCGVRSCPGDCRGRGRCESGRCVCWPGYTGRDCGTRACPGDCRGRGRCVDGRCVCNPGFAGEDCGSRRCPGDCRGRGRCEDGVCSCDVGYEGEDCGTRSCPRGCQGRGQCLEGRCVCDDGYEGEDCGVRRCPRDCNQRGVCQDGVCTCWEGFAGEDCGLRVCPSNCHRHGRCENGRCVCDSGYTGPSCATRTCPADCRGHGRCVQGMCVCHLGYSGEDCGQEEPPASACPGGCGPRELCRAGQCVCVEGFRGPDCAIQTCPRDCRGRGECREGSCVCQDGYAGEDCGEEVPAIEGMRMHLLEETTVRTEWTRAPGNVDAYEIQFIPTTEGASPPFTARVPSSASAYDQRGLAPGQEYQVTVRALRGTSWGPPASKTITTMIDGPQDLRVVAVTPTTLELNWLRPQAEVDRFVVSYVSAGNQRVRLEVPSEADGTLLTGLMPGVEYVVTVTAERGRAVSYPASIRANTGSSPSGLLGATDEPPPSGPSTTQGAQAPVLQQRPQELAELRVLGKDKTGRLRVAWTAQPDTFTHFQLRLRVPEGPGAHEELLPGDVRQALVPSPPAESPYELSLRGIPPSGEPSAPLIYQGIMDKDGEKPGKPLAPPRLGKLTVTDVTSDSLLLHWTVPEGEFDSFVIEYKDRDRPQVVPVEGPQRTALISNLDVGRKYKFVLYGLVGKKRHGPLVAEAKILPQTDPSPVTPPRLGTLWVTDPTPDSLHLSWTVPEGQFDSFVVQYRDKDGRPQVVPVEGPERSVIISPLDPDHKYRFTLFGIANKKRHGPLTADGTTAPEKKEEPRHAEPPEQPLLGELTVTGTTADSLRLSWTVAQGSFDSFVVQYKDAQGRPQAVPVRGDENEVSIPGLEPNRKYKMNLYGLHGRQRVGPVSVVATTVPQEVLDETPSTTEMEETLSPTEPSTEAPEPRKKPLLGELTVTGSSPDSLSLSWTVPQGHFDSFTVQYRDGDGQPRVMRVPGDEDGVTISGLEPDHKYKMNLYGFHDRQRVGPVSVIGVTTSEEETPSPTEMEETPSPTEVEETPSPTEMEETPSPTEPSTEAPEPPEEPLLGELTVTGSSPDSLSLSWTVPQGHFDSFTVQYKNGDGQPQVVRVPGDEDEVTVSGLEPDHKYKMNLYGFHDRQRVGPVSVIGVTTAEEETPSPTEMEETPSPTEMEETPSPTEPSTEAPEPPEEPLLGELTVTGSSPDSLSLSWTVPQGHFDSFTVQYKGRDGPQVVRVGGEETEVTVGGLEPGRKYKMNLYGLHGGRRVGPVSTVGVTAPQAEETPPATEPPKEPRLGELTVTDVTPNSVGLAWTVPEGQFDSFVVQYKDRDGQPHVIPVAADQREVTVSGLEPERKYRMNVYGLHGGQRVGPLSVVALTAPVPPAPVTEPPVEPRLGELTVTDVTPDSVGLSWTVAEGKFDSFLVQYKDRDGQPQVVPVAADQREVTVPGLEPSRKYKFLLFGIQDGKRRGPVSVEAKTVGRGDASPGAPPRLGELWVTDPTPDSLRLSWTVPEGHFDSFVVQFKDRDGPRVVSVEGHERSVTISPLDSGRKYRFLVYGLLGKRRHGPLTAEGTTETHRAVDESGTKRPSKPRLGEELQVTGVTSDSVGLSWTVPEGHFDSFVIQYRDRDGQPQVVPVEGSHREVSVSGLDPARRYKLLLYGLSRDKRVGPISTIAVTEPAPREEIEAEPETFSHAASEPHLGEVTLEEATPHSLHLSWTATEGEFDSFEVQYTDEDGQRQEVNVGGDQHDITISDLESDHRYLVSLYGFHNGQRVGPAHIEAMTAPREEDDEPSESPSTPQTPSTVAPKPPIKPRLGELEVTDATPDSLSLFWTIPEGQFDHFLIQYKNGDGQPKVVRVPGDEDEVTISGLEPDHKYKMNLYGFHDRQRVGPVSVIGVTTAEEETPSPTEMEETPSPTEMEETPSPTEPSTEAPEPPEEPLLGELMVTGSSPDSLSLSWTVPQGHFDSFTVQYKNGDGQPQVVRVPGDEDEVTVSGLEPDHKYKMNLYGFHDRQRVGPVSVIGMTTAEEETPSPTEMEETPSPTEPSTEAPEPPEEPLLGELTVTGSSPDSLSLSWTVPQGHFDSFTVQYKGRDGPQVVRVGGEETEVTVGGLEPGRKYKMNLYGLHGGQRMGPVSTVGVTASEKDHEMTPAPTDLPTAAPEPPTKPRLGELAVTDATPDSLSLSWTIPEGQFDHFLIQYKNGDGQPKAVRVPGDEDEVTISGLEPDHKYKMNLYGFHDRQRVGPVSVIGVTTAEEETPSPTEMEETPSPTEPSTEAPEPPEEPLLGELTVTGSSPDSLSLSWTVPQGHFDSFTVQYKNGDGQPQVVRVPGHDSGVTISGLEPDHKYKMNLYGFHDRQRVGPVSVIGVTTAEEETPSPTEMEETPSPTEPSTEAPERPEEPLLGELMVTGSSPDSLSLSWTVPQGHFDSFTVQYKGRDGPQVVRVGGEETEVTVGGLEPGRKYKMNLYGLLGGQRVGPVSTVGVTDPQEVVEETPSPTEPSTEAPEPPEEPLLGELTVTGSSPDSLSLSWTVPQGHFDSFTVQYKGRDGPQVMRVRGEETEVTIGGLESGHKYKMNLYGLHGGRRVGPVSTVGVTALDYDSMTTQTPSTAVPEPPTKPRLGELTVTDATPDSLSLSWTVPEGQFDHFLIQYKNGDGQPKAVRVPGDEDEVTISGLEPDHKYKMNLYGFHDRQRVGPVSVIGVTTAEEETPSPTEVEETPSPTEPSTEAPEPPEEPLLGELTVTGSSPDSLSLSWTVPQGHFDSFTVQYKGRDGPQVVRVGGEETEVTVGGLEPGHKYKMNLYGLHGGQRVGPVSTVGVTASLTTEPRLAPRLGELTVAAVTSDTARLSWTVEQGPFDSFLVQYKDVQGQPQTVPVGGDLREVTVSSLAPGRKYKFLLFGLRDEKRHGPVSADAKTLPDTKPAPRLGELTVTDVTPDSVGLSWTVPEGEFDSFVVQYKDRDGQPRMVPVAADQREVTIPGLEPNRKYKFLLYGLVGRKRLGPISAEGSTAPLEKERQPPPRLGELTVTDETPNSLRLSWTVAQGPFDSFVVQYRGTDGQPQMVPVAADQREVTVEGLEPGRKYKFLLYGLLRGQRLGPASVLGMTAPEEDTPAPWRPATEAPKPPEGPRLGVLAVRDVSPDSLRLSWSVVRGPFDSFVVQYQDTDGQPQALLVGGDQNKVLVSGLEPSTSYKFFLYGLHEGKRLGPVSADGTTGPVPAGQTPGEPGPRLSHLSVTDVTTSSLRLNWEAPPEAFDSFLLRFGVPSPSTLEPQLRPLLQRELTVPGTRRSAVLRDLHPGTLYTLTLYGLRGPHKADSIQGTARTLSPVLESPRDLQFSEIRETSARVSWTPPASRVDGFKVSYQLADGGEPQSVQVDGRTQKLEGLIPGAQYEVTVVSVRGFEESEPLTGFLTTVPDGPTQLRALNLTDESALLHWKPPQTPVDTYDVKVTAPGAPSLQASAPGSAMDYPLQGLVTHTNYTATLRGLRGPNFTSPASITFTTGLEAPQDLEAKEVTPRTALLTWTAPEVSPTGYLLSFNTPGGQTQEILLPGRVTSHQLRGLFPSTPYSTWLRAMWGDSFTPPVSTSFTTGGLRIPFPRDCGEEMQNGVSTSRTTTIFLNGNRERPLNVFCDMETDGGGWLVFQRRMDGKTDFWRDWEDYAHGFGNISGEFWLGNEALHSLTKAGDYSLRVDLRAGDEAVFAQYDSFQVDSADEYYRLHLEGYHGTAGDSMSYHSGSVFSARDRDPNNLLISCAVSYRGAWWYRNCHYANLNGLYGSTVDHQGVSWYYWKGFDFSVPFTEMKLRPRSYRPPGRGG
ncbi:tenascin-X isoform X2 [Dama dama]|uniref:tenascin-X isoform X2 n=1 Tax=Dama dama TaxID=30532 RepID=UPI002A358F1F|nr:tenascin-X isoform X2 [Dama dama]